MVFGWKGKLKPALPEPEKVEFLLKRGSAEGETRTATARWLRGDLLMEAALRRSDELYYSTERQAERPSDSGTIYLGDADRGGQVPLGWCDDRHLITVAGSRSGKGVSAILPNLLLYPGSVICIDPKGENAAATAAHRANEMGQDVYVLDPYDTADDIDPALKATYDPLAAIVESLDRKEDEIIERIGFVADALVVPSPGNADPHWDELARAFISALIGHVLTAPGIAHRNLVEVRKLLNNGDAAAARAFEQEDLDEAYARYMEAVKEATDQGLEESDVDASLYFNTASVSPHDGLFRAMRRNKALHGLISGFAQRLLDMGHEERGSVLSSTDRHTRFIDGPNMGRTLVAPPTTRRLDLAKLKTGKRPMTIYLCLPTRYFSTHSRWLRLMINLVMASVENERELLPGGRRILAILDEFPVLKYMSSIENAVGFMAGYGLQIWAILQDLSQLKRDYPNSWETFLGNAGMKQFFGNTDHTTLEYISKSLGETEVVQKTNNISVASQMEREAARTGRSSSLDNLDRYASSQTSEQISKTALLNPSEISNILRRASDRQIILTSEFIPILCYRRKHYKMLEDNSFEALRNRP